MVAGGLTEKVTSDRSVSFCFYSCGEIPPPVIMVQVIFLPFQTSCKVRLMIIFYFVINVHILRAGIHELIFRMLASATTSKPLGFTRI